MMLKRLIFTIIFLTAVIGVYQKKLYAVNSEYEVNKLNEMRYVFENTSYCALIQERSTSSKLLPFNPEEEPFRRKVVTYEANVLETYKGKEMKTLTFDFFVEEGAVSQVASTPYILCLCNKEESYYIPDVVPFRYPDNGKFREVAREAGKITNNNKMFFCDE